MTTLVKNRNNEAYLARCQATLKTWGAPLEGWQCTDLIDYSGPDGSLSTCELCGCTKVRFIHVMHHPFYFDPVEVGCVCAGVMEGDELAARERERKARNRAQRRTTFLNKPWRTLANGNQMLRHKGQNVFINHTTRGNYKVRVGNQVTWQYKGKPITSQLAATYAAFDLIDSKEN